MTIYIELMNEGTNCWRPVEAKDLGDGRFQILGSQPEGEEWQFRPGEIVECRKKQFQDGLCIVAHKLAS
jgi:hypothetical protein